MAFFAALKFGSIALILFCFAVAAVMARRGVVAKFKALIAFILVVGTRELLYTSILFYRNDLHLSKRFAYRALFANDTVCQLLELCLFVLIVYGLFYEAMRPFPGLQRIGRIIFGWVGAVSLLVALALSAGPKLFSQGVTLVGLYNEIAPRFQQGTHVLVLCLLIFVCFAIRPLGLTFRSHIFGVVLGLAIFSTTELIQVGWIEGVGGVDLYSGVYLFAAVGDCVAMFVWGAYFALPEPKRQMILLPTTSPFFLWNRISEILGDAPGKVAVAGFTPDMLAPAEIEMLTIAISREDASARERESALVGSGASSGIAELPAPSEPAFALSR